MADKLERLEAYLRSLENLANLFAPGLPPKEALAHALDREEALRGAVAAYGALERSAVAFDCGLQSGDLVDEAVELARQGRLSESKRLTKLVDYLFPDEEGIGEQVVRAMTGASESARENLVALARDKDRMPAARRNAVVALERIGELDHHVACGFDLVREFVATHDFRNASDAAYEVAEALCALHEESQSAWGNPDGGPRLLN